MKDRKNLLAVGLLTLLAAITRLVHFGKPLSVVFDETYFLKFIGYYWNGTYFFDVHPPLGKLLFVLFAYLTGITPTADIGTIGASITSSLVLFRILPLVAGIVLPVVIYYICRNLNLSRLSAFFAGALVCLENSLIVQSRFVLIDMILILFGFLSLLFYLQYRNKVLAGHTGWISLISSAVFFAGAISVKWTGLFFIVPIVAFELYDLYSSRHPRKRKFLRLIRNAVIYGIISLVLYMSFFAVHFALLPKDGPGNAFMTPRFQKTLEGNRFQDDPALIPPLFMGKFFELNAEMFDAHTRMTVEHNYASKYYTWPLMVKPIYYWYEGATTLPAMHSRIYLIGNPVIYWGGAIAVLILLIHTAWMIIRRRFHYIPKKKILTFILIGFLANFLPFIFIGRVMFLYHYSIALIMSIMALAYIIDMIPERTQRIRLALLFLVLTALTFHFFSPLTYGLPQTEYEYETRVWFESWR